MSCLWRSALPGVASIRHCKSVSLSTNWQQEWEWILSRREHFHRWSTSCPPSVIRWSKSRDHAHTAGPNQWTANGQYIRWIRANGSAQWMGQRPWPSSHWEAPHEQCLCFRHSEVRNQSYYPGEEGEQAVSGLFSGFVRVNSSSVRLCTF